MLKERLLDDLKNSMKEKQRKLEKERQEKEKQKKRKNNYKCRKIYKVKGM